MLTIIVVSLVALLILALVFLFVDYKDNEVPYVRIVKENDYVPGEKSNTPGFAPSTTFGARLTE